MQAKVPKFIDIEDKVIGPLTWRQFAYLAGGLGFAMLFVWRFKGFLGFPLAAVALSLGLALAFAKVNDRPFIAFMGAFWRYYSNSRRYFWEKERVPVEARKEKSGQQAQKQLSQTAVKERLKEVARALDTHARVQHKDY